LSRSFKKAKKGGPRGAELGDLGQFRSADLYERSQEIFTARLKGGFGTAWVEILALVILSTGCHLFTTAS
jgi:hypothetical protein